MRDVDLELRSREIVALVGPSGCGKTTLLRCIDGLIPCEGEITIDGKRVTEPPPGVAMVFQHFGLFPWKTVYDNVAYGLRMAGASAARSRRRVPRFITLVGLAGFEQAYPYQISGGMQQRCGLARALAIEPKCLADGRALRRGRRADPRDPAIRTAAHLGKRPTTMLFVTHSIEEAVLMGDRVVVLKGRPSACRPGSSRSICRGRGRRETLSLPRFSELREQVWSNLMNEARRAEFELEP